jgi:diguanylate cyclase (GGDEF)-like protein
MDKSDNPLPQGTYIELIRSLFATRLTTLIMVISFVGTGLVVNAQTPDHALDLLMASGAGAAIWRFLVLVTYGKESQDAALTYARARRLEWIFAVPYLLFAVIFGAFSARAFMVAAPDAHVLITGLLFGYGAGVAAGISYRLWISVTAIVVAVVPTALVALMSADSTYWAAAGLLAVFLGGGIHSMIQRYHYAAAGINMSQLFERLARSDALTGLANRLALSEKFAAVASTTALTAVHCLDLDRFKSVNDQLGHPTGDMLLQAVAHRLNGLLRGSDFAARTGGDEFVVVQSAMSNPGEVELLAARLRRSLGEPFRLDGRTVQIGASVGYVLSSQQGHDLERLIACADSALLDAKASGGGVRAYMEPLPVDLRRAG